MSNLFKEEKDDTNQVKFEFNFKISVNQFCEIKYISVTVHLIKQNSKTYYFKW